MKRFVCMLLTLALFAAGVGAVEVPAVSAKSVVLMDADSGRVLYARNEHEPRLIASITKLMTALLAVESAHDLDETVMIQPEWTGIEGSSLYLKPGETLRLETLLYGLLLRSGNDAAHAIAGYCAGDLKVFAAKMNEKAAQLGMKHTHFDNPSGLNSEEHYSSAYDMALLARACLENETLSKIVSTKNITLENRIFTNHNKLLWQYDGCVGLKTGYTELAGRTLVSAARRDGMTLICVTLSDPNDWRDHAALFDYGFANYQRRALVNKGDLICCIPIEGSLIPMKRLRAQTDLYAAVGPQEQVKCEVVCSKWPCTTPVYTGDMLGHVQFTAADKLIGQLELRLPCDIPRDIAPERSGLARFFGR